MISHEINWFYISDTSDTSNKAISSDASKTSASVTRLSSYFSVIPYSVLAITA